MTIRMINERLIAMEIIGMALAGVFPNIEEHNVNDGADSHHFNCDGEIHCNTNAK